MQKSEKVLSLRQPDYDEVLFYKSFHGNDAECGVKIWVVGSGAGSEMPHRYIVVATELTDNPGMSVTNAYETIATEVLHQLLPKADPEIITWIEHYPPRGNAVSLRLPETYDLVLLRFDGNQFRMDTRNNQHPWKHLTEKDLRELGLVV